MMLVMTPKLPTVQKLRREFYLLYTNFLTEMIKICNYFTSKHLTFTKPPQSSKEDSLYHRPEENYYYKNYEINIGIC